MKARDTVTFTVRISRVAADRARAHAADLGMPLGEYIDHLIMEQAPPAFAYHAQHAAFQSLVATAFSLAIARRALTQAEFQAAQQHAYQAAAMLFGEPPGRPESLGAPSPHEDPRLDALFEAYAGVTR
ncbi:hypothetical protein OVA11_19430 [Caulobacter sp. SL161]|uniref:hypothetical protein n=1 Tax=Caulobacter sp. SL161 TaxID=2995156 RepID=UPI0022729546|nr:hypothetical protein [Caulobacter sp. SL161]MCY1649150.1 hypothetical protein [Caulobacter sp. SL161]